MARCSALLFFVLLLGTAVAHAQENRYMVFFRDKAGTAFSTAQPSAFLSQRSLARRAKNGVGVSEADLPVVRSYVEQISATGVPVFYTTRWLNGLLVQTTPALAAQIGTLPFVSRVEQVAPGGRLPSGRTKKIKNKTNSGIAPETLGQLSMLGMDAMHAESVRGEGVLIAVFDSGYQGVDTAGPFAHLWSDQRISYTFDFVGNGAEVFRYDDHGTEVFSVISARSGTYTGGAPDAAFHLYVTEDVRSEYRIEEYNWLFAAERADSAGVDIIQSSLGYNTFDDAAMDYAKGDLDGQTAIVSQAAALALARGMVVVASAGNEGNNAWQLVTPPADVDGVLAVGSVTANFTKSSFSSVGPTADGRLKPDVVALGSGTQVVRPNGTNGFSSGTSLAAPLVTSLAAGLLQRFPQLTVAKLYEAITATASQANQPNQLLGFGIPNYLRMVSYLSPEAPDEEITIYPNPVSGAHVHVLLKTVQQPVTVTVHELQGRVLQEESVFVSWQNNPLSIDLSNLPAGMYLLVVRAGAHSRTERIIKQ